MGDYFITICTKNRLHHFGKIFKTADITNIELTTIGSFVKDCIISIPEKYKEVTIGESVVMPNHIHLIINLPYKDLERQGNPSSIPQINPLFKGLQPLMPGSVPSIVNHLKGEVKKWCNSNGHPSFQWQLRYHDHIIRNSKSYKRISNYIVNNILNWTEDENNEGGNNFRKDVRT